MSDQIGIALAGVTSVLMTLIPVGDKTSREFMEKFHDHYLAENFSPAEALHKTRLDFIHDGRPLKGLVALCAGGAVGNHLLSVIIIWWEKKNIPKKENFCEYKIDSAFG